MSRAATSMLAVALLSVGGKAGAVDLKLAPQGGELFANLGFSTYLFNSLVAAGGSAVVSVVLGSMCAYSLSRIEFRGKSDLFFWIISTRMAPVVAVLVPLLLRRELHDLRSRGRRLLLGRLWPEALRERDAGGRLGRAGACFCFVLKRRRKKRGG